MLITKECVKHTQKHENNLNNIQIHACMRKYTRAHKQTCLHAFAVYSHTYVHMCIMRMPKNILHAYIRTYIHTYIYT
jgi:hypothetical protein